MGLRQPAAVLVAVSLSGLACYSPNIAAGGFTCGSDGGCPDKFHCASDNRCYQGDAQTEMPPVCNTVTTVQPITSTFCANAAVSDECSPTCQTGCNSCGWCAVVGGAATCLTGTAGTTDVGSPCDPSRSSDCLPGLYCQPEPTCGTVTGTCYRLCDPSDTTNEVCGAGSGCNLTAKKNGGGSAPFTLCSPVCDPISQTSAGCQAPFACYPSGLNMTECDCAGTAGTGQSCLLAEQCVPGDACAGPSGAATCRPTCSATVGCTSGTCTILGTATYGTCM